jgi:hypothetical protein
MGSLVEQANTRAVSNDNAALGPHLFCFLLSKAIAGGSMSCMNEAHSTEFMVNRVLFAVIYAVIFSELAGTVYFTFSAPIDARAMSFSSVLLGMLNIGAFTLIPAILFDGISGADSSAPGVHSKEGSVRQRGGNRGWAIRIRTPDVASLIPAATVIDRRRHLGARMGSLRMDRNPRRRFVGFGVASPLATRTGKGWEIGVSMGWAGC